MMSGRDESSGGQTSRERSGGGRSDSSSFGRGRPSRELIVITMCFCIWLPMRE